MKFQFVRASDIRRHHDCDLDNAVEGTCNIYSVHNTAEPLKLKVRNVICLCRQCILDGDEECLNSAFTDVWHEVKLKPVKGESEHKHQKKKDPREMCRTIEVEHDNDSDDEHLPDIVIENEEGPEETTVVDSGVRSSNADELFIDLTEGVEGSQDNLFKNVEEVDIITAEHMQDSVTLDFQTEDDIPDQMYWESVLSSIERCTDYNEMLTVIKSLQETLKPLRKRNINVYFDQEKDYVNATAADSIPSDGPLGFSSNLDQ